MSGFVMEKAGIVSRKRTAPAVTQRRGSTASNTVSAAVAAVLGATTPVAAAAPKPISVVVSEFRTEWRVHANSGHEVPLLPMRFDKDPAVDASAVAGLNDALSFADAVRRALPVDEEMDQLAELAFERHASQLQRRQIVRK